MYYLGRGGVPVPAEEPSLTTTDGKHEWVYSQLKHQAALKNVKGVVEHSVPKVGDAKLARVQANTRRFCEDQKRAEIGRENRKLVDRMNSIARGYGATDPRAPPPAAPPQPLGVPRAGSCNLRPLAAASLTASGPISSGPIAGVGSLHEPHRRKTQRSIEQDNASLVRRILSVKTTFDSRGDEKDFRRHRRTVQLLQRLPDGSSASRRPPRPSSLPPIRPPRPGILSGPVRGLEELFLPGDLQRSESGPGSFSNSGDRAKSPLMRERHAASAPIACVEDLAPAFAGEEEDYRAGGASGPPTARQHPSSETGGASRGDRAPPPASPPPASPPGPGKGMQGCGPNTSPWPVEDKKTERRQWCAGEEAMSPADPRHGESDQEDSPDRRGDYGPGLVTGMSTESLQYAEEWDEYSMASSGGSPLRSRSLRGGEGSTFGGTSTM